MQRSCCLQSSSGYQLDHDSFGGLEEEAEEIELVELSFDEAREKLTAGEIFDAKTMILLQHFFMGRS